MSKNLLYRLIVLFGVLGASASAVFVRYTTAPSVVIAMYRMGFAAVLLLPVIGMKHIEELKKLEKKDLIFCILSGMFLAGHFYAYFESLHYTSVASSTVLVDTEVFFVALVTVGLFHEKISKRGVIGILVTFIGSVLLAMADKGKGSDIIHGDILALAGAVFVAIYTLIGRRQRSRMTTTVYTFLVYGSAFLTLAVLCLFMKTPVIGYTAQNYIMALLLTLCCTFLGHSIFSWGLKYLPAAFISTAKLGEPVFATVLSVFLFAEIPQLLQIAGGVVIITGLYLYTSEKTGN